MSLNNIITFSIPNSVFAEAYKVLRTSIQFYSIKKNIKSFLITSSNSNEGKSITIANLAIAFAQTRKKVIVIDANFLSPKIHEYFGLENKEGLSNYLNKSKDTNIFLNKNIGVEGLDILTSGTLVTNPSELLATDVMRCIIKGFSLAYDLVLIDSPSARLVTDTQILSTIADATLFVVASEKVKSEELKKSINLLKQVNANIIGTILNMYEGMY